MLSIFEIYSIGIGPSSSHTVGPMRAANKFCNLLANKNLLPEVDTIMVELYGSLALTGKGHGTDKALILGLLGNEPETVDIDSVDATLEEIAKNKTVLIHNKKFEFNPAKNIIFHRRKSLPEHPNGMCFIASNKGTEVFKKIYFSVGGGFIAGKKQVHTKIGTNSAQVKYPFRTGDDLLKLHDENNLSISEMVWANERTWRNDDQIKQDTLHIWKVMQECMQRGVQTEGVLPGGLNVKRRAPKLYQRYLSIKNSDQDPLMALDWVNLYALAVNEENAAGGRVVTAPTNGAAGILPAVLQYYCKYHPEATDDGIIRFLLTAGAVAILYKYNASISGADVGCQGEVGVACSMAAAGLTEALGGSVRQVENAAEIAMEHNLGLTCDPIGGLVQVPCIERNAMGAVKAINASRMALRGDGHHFVSLDKVIKTMYATGKDMRSKYKETSRGGLAVNIIEC